MLLLKGITEHWIVTKDGAAVKGSWLWQCNSSLVLHCDSLLGCRHINWA